MLLFNYITKCFNIIFLCSHTYWKFLLLNNRKPLTNLFAVPLRVFYFLYWNFFQKFLQKWKKKTFQEFFTNSSQDFFTNLFKRHPTNFSRKTSMGSWKKSFKNSYLNFLQELWIQFFKGTISDILVGIPPKILRRLFKVRKSRLLQKFYQVFL